MLINAKTLSFISENADADVRKLALSAPRSEDIDLMFALDQIQGRQTARRKLPSWAAIEGVVYPHHISMEQCSSEVTARYKASVLQRFVDGTRGCLVDITGGFGVDFSFLAQGFSRCVYVEQQSLLCDIAQHNMPLLNLKNAEVVCGDGSEYVMNTSFEENLAVFIDPARRDANGNRTYAIGDCTPNIIGFIDEMAQKAEVILIKLSPMLDWHATVADINKAVKGHSAVREVHIISTGNECKELLLVVSTRSNGALKVYCVNDNDVFSFTENDENADEKARNCSANAEEEVRDCSANAEEKKRENGEICEGEADNEAEKKESLMLYVPNASVMKAGCFRLLSLRFGIKQIGKNSHLYLSMRKTTDFPGRCFRVKAMSSMNKKELKQALNGIEKANITTRNFPISPEQLRKRLKIKDGGSIYIFATTDDNDAHLLLITEKG